MKFQDLIAQIREYESDTFSASGSKITYSEAKVIAEYLLEVYVYSTLDGCKIANCLSDIRDE